MTFCLFDDTRFEDDGSRIDVSLFRDVRSDLIRLVVFTDQIADGMDQDIGLTLLEFLPVCPLILSVMVFPSDVDDRRVFDLVVWTDVSLVIRHVLVASSGLLSW